MLEKLSHLIFIIIFIAVFIIDGWGLPQGRSLSLVVLIFAPSILMLLHLFTKKKIYIPKIAIWFSIFLFFNAFSTFHSTDFQRSRDYLTYYFSLFVIFIYVLNNSESLKSIYVKVLFSLGILTFFYWTAFKFFLSSYFTFLIPGHGYQLIHPFAGYLTHHPIGVVGLILVSITSVSLFNKITFNQLIIFIISLAALLISFMRAGYIAFFGALLVLIYKYRKIPTQVFVVTSVVLFLLFLAFFMVTSPDYGESPIKRIFNTKINHVNVNNKTLLNARDYYYLQSFHAIVEKPLFGFGPHNFFSASEKYIQNKYVFTTTSTNILLDFMVENGVVAGVAFFYFFIVIAINAYRSVSLHDEAGMKLFMLYVSLLILFQFSYYHGSHTIFLTFIIVGGLIYKEEKSETDDYKLTLIASVLIPIIYFIGRMAPLI
ncbi:hypothetical protein A3A93_03865 [Candidatus Roizmanbacteria bacterium RIFCSPLOWO2_01_FULL_38_12]|uniref:O-antigen ligase-related domain-containing protein n=1 Tax=Candidatus Roizmanbacteria bacterium RIFCSPLOWO2_01_FULL_38_12 TaxID=1802061 RepID=A0A1F7IYX5_9BACT|nr:MAG: hypothetical protein A2861_04205 [Candidatus Roizmanbacteria bacterium RIFCSPHIGHO2_01_FULL_38_15]OGK34950.1 MAG: hypothetical protein A3F59_03815 [Candidatus Roizmanbacteria bacterium RIFCSPHIGHO2_12_FULL_38_13]OGK48576.1 MAG: hypothetical protein A3A93_03865 [Candidatus Roizmanbacteria bacterium RIFCSPLOWO2_01_FULL_38_12]